MTRPRAARHAFGVSISETSLFATLPAIHGEPTRREWPLTPLSRADAEWPTLVAALIELRAALGDAHHALAVALLPPIAKVRRVELPKLRAGELRLVLTRNAGRYLPGVREPHTADGIALANATPTPYLMAAAPTRVVEVVARAAQDSGWTLATIVPAHAAWTVAALHTWPGQRRSGDVAIRTNGHVDVLQLQDGRLARLHRLRDGEEPAGLAANALEHPEYAAATAAPAAIGPELLPERVYAQRARAQRRRIVRSVVGLAAVLVLGAVGVLARAQYVLHQVVLQRTALQARADKAMAARDAIGVLTTPVTALGRIETNAVLWSQVLADLTEVLPQDASLKTLRAHGDTLAVTGTAEHGGTVFEHMDGAKLIENVRPTGPIRHDAKPGAPSLDRFEFAARIPGAVPLYAHKATKRPAR